MKGQVGFSTVLPQGGVYYSYAVQHSGLWWRRGAREFSPPQMIGCRIWQAAKGVAAVLLLTCHIRPPIILQPIVQHYNHPMVLWSRTVSVPQDTHKELYLPSNSPQPTVNIPRGIYRPYILPSPYLARILLLSPRSPLSC